jgi:hypothetical protein
MDVLEPLHNIINDVPDWLSRLDELKSQIIQRQAELAKITDQQHPPRSLKNKGSTESLRPKDNHENPFLSDETIEKEADGNPFDTPVTNGTAEFLSFSGNGGASPIAAKTQRIHDSASPEASAIPATAPKSPTFLQRQLSKRSPAARPKNNPLPGSPPSPFGLPALPSPATGRKRKGSMASGDTSVPKYRTKSMIIVYYDSDVQQAFTELVKFVSAARNAMRKSKMASRMQEMRRLAEAEAQREESKIEGEDSMDADPDDDNEVYIPPKLNFVSTRRMGPSRDAAALSALGYATNNRSKPSFAGRGIPSASSGVPDIYEELDKGLEYCQNMCEHAAHQSLRDGQCGSEIVSIKLRLAEVRETSEKYIQKIQEEKEAKGREERKHAEVPSRSLKDPQMRREIKGADGAPGDIEIDELEIDDEEDAVMPALTFKSTRAYRV